MSEKTLGAGLKEIFYSTVAISTARENSLEQENNFGPKNSYVFFSIGNQFYFMELARNFRNVKEKQLQLRFSLHFIMSYIEVILRKI